MIGGKDHTNFYKHRQCRCDTVDVITHFIRKVMNVSLNRWITEMTYQIKLETPSILLGKDIPTSIFVQA
jgi:hypothetical protein